MSVGRILIIDDDPLVLKTFQKVLINEGYEVIPASSYESALESFSKKEFDLVLSDIRMPGKNGVETVAEIQSKLKEAGKADLPIIFITGYADYGQEINARFHGEILSKPVDVQRLISAVRDYL